MATSLPSSTESETDSDGGRDSPVEMRHSNLTVPHPAGFNNKDEYQLDSHSQEKNFDHSNSGFGRPRPATDNITRRSRQNNDFDESNFGINDAIPNHSSNHLHNTAHNNHDVIRRNQHFDDFYEPIKESMLIKYELRVLLIGEVDLPLL